MGPELGRVPLPHGRQLAVYACDLSGGIMCLGADHDDVRWLTPDELDSIDWLDADRDVLPAVCAALEASSSLQAPISGVD